MTTLHDIDHAIADVFDVSEAELRSPRRTKRVTQARGVAFFLAREHTDRTLTEIGTHYGGRDHSSVLGGIQRARICATRDEKFLMKIEHANSILTGNAIFIRSPVGFRTTRKEVA